MRVVEQTHERVVVEAHRAEVKIVRATAATYRLYFRYWPFYGVLLEEEGDHVRVLVFGAMPGTLSPLVFARVPRIVPLPPGAWF